MILLRHFLSLMLRLLLVMMIAMLVLLTICFLFFKQKTAYEMSISDWSSDVCSSDLLYVRHSVSRPLYCGVKPHLLATLTISSTRSEERRVGKECVSTCISGLSP